jgi:hypothetical protein
VPPAGIGVITPSCADRSEKFSVPVRVGEGLRVAGKVSLCFVCGPEGSVFHPENGVSIGELRQLADRLPFSTGYDPADLTPGVKKAYDDEMRRRLARR